LLTRSSLHTRVARRLWQTFFGATELATALAAFALIDRSRPIPPLIRYQLLWTMATIGSVHLIQSTVDQGYMYVHAAACAARPAGYSHADRR